MVGQDKVWGGGGEREEGRGERGGERKERGERGERRGERGGEREEGRERRGGGGREESGKEGEGEWRYCKFPCKRKRSRCQKLLYLCTKSA